MILLPIDIVGLAQRNGLSQTVQGEVRIDTGSQAVDAQIRAIFWEASQATYAVLASRSHEAPRVSAPQEPRHAPRRVSSR